MIHKGVTTIFSIRILAVFFIVIGAAACKSTDTAQSETSTNDRAELEKLYWNRVDSSRMSFTDADVKFMRGMIAHHAQALIMSRLAPENGASEDVQTLSSRIINAQKDEIATMQQWLKDRDQPVPETKIDGLELKVVIDNEPYTKFRDMPGVLSKQKIKELSKAEGSNFDQLFLKYMIEHHSGAVKMVEKLFNTDGAAQDKEAFRLASDIQVDQRTEIKRMNLMLDRLSQNSQNEE